MFVPTVFNSGYFNNIDTEDKAYWFGFILADGGLHRNGKQVRVLLSSKDRNHLVKLAELFRVQVRDEAYTDKRNGKTYFRSIVQLNSVRLWTAIIEKGVPQRKCDFASASVLQFVPAELRRHFIRGYFDGDGCISKIGHAEYRLTIVGPKCLLCGIREIVSASLGAQCAPADFRSGIWRITWCGTDRLNRIKRWFYDGATVFLERKKLIFDDMPRFRGSSQYKGVYYIQAKRHWVARIYRDKHMKTIGQFRSEAEAKQALDRYVVGFDSAVPAVMADFVRT